MRMCVQCAHQAGVWQRAKRLMLRIIFAPRVDCFKNDHRCGKFQADGGARVRLFTLRSEIDRNVAR